ncbi:hypothetical protein EV714DRAFT_205083 [Schizophyllum commune]
MSARAFTECFDLLLLALSFLETDCLALASCALPPAQILSAMMPRYADLVHSLEIGRFLPKKAHGIRKQLGECIAAFRNLQHVALIPIVAREDVFWNVIPLLPKLQYLKRLEINRLSHSVVELAVPEASTSSTYPAPLPVPQRYAMAILMEEGEEEEEGVVGTDNSKAESVPAEPAPEAQVTRDASALHRLEALTIHAPSRAVLDALPAWLSKLSGTLRELHLLGDCGSITPGVLTSLSTCLRDVTALSLGLSYSLTDATIFDALAKFPDLADVHLAYYLQLNSPAHFPRLANLRKFAVDHPRFETADAARRFATWVRKAIRGTSRLEVLRLICGQEHDEPLLAACDNRSVDGLASHVSAKHAHSLRVLDLGTATHVSKQMVEQICKTCTRLEELRLCLSKDSLDVVRTHVASLPYLHTAAFLLKNSVILPLYNIEYTRTPEFLCAKYLGPPRGLAEFPKMSLVMPEAILYEGRCGRLRWISVNDIFWESLWRVDATDGEMKYFVAGPRKLASKETPRWRVIGEREGG